ncbi:MAG: hypothetical protein HWE16_00830 [Gammaproteobacteria bacterium]|nr:hypothetical protein [Gammaproteobacteria bacterium]
MTGKSKFLLVFFCFIPLLLISCGDDKATSDNSSKSAPLAKPKVQNREAPEVSVVGNLYAAVNGERQKWYLIQSHRTEGNETTGNWRPMAQNHSVQVTMTGLTDKSARATSKGDIQVRMTLENVEQAAKPVLTEIELFADGYSRSWSSAENGKAQVFINRFEMDDDILDIGGGFYGSIKLAKHSEGDATSEIKDLIFAVKVPKYK